MQKLLMVGWIGAFVCAFLCYPILGLLSNMAVDAYIIVPKDKESQLVEEEIWEPPKGKSKDSPEYRESVLRIYGVPTEEPTKVLFVPQDKFIVSRHAPSLKILPKEQNWVQLKTFYFLAPRVMLGAAVVGFLLVLPWIMLRKKAQKAAAPPPAA